MITRHMQILYKLFIILALVIVAGCGANNSPQSASNGAITANLFWVSTGKTTAKTVASAPAGVTTVRIIVSATGMTTIQKDFTAASGSGTISGVLAGTGRTLTAQGLDGTGTVIYQGTAANLTVQAGQTTNAGTITMTAAGAAPYSISGTVTSSGASLSGVTVSTSGGSAITDVSGNYAINGLVNGSYILAPSKIGYTFTPSSQSITIAGANISGNNLTATVAAVNTYSVSGTIIGGGSALAGATVTLSGNGSTITITDSNGNYSFSGVQIGSYSILPSKVGYTFVPNNLSVVVIRENFTGKNFEATGSTTTGATMTSGTVMLPKTGQTIRRTTNDDGDLRKGAVWPIPRFTDNHNGTITDNLTGLAWLKNANCFDLKTWSAALTSANFLAHGQCDLTDGSAAGQWRLPNINELESLIDISQSFPAISIGHPFTSVPSERYDYWSSSSRAEYATSYAWSVEIYGGSVNNDKAKTTDNCYVWPVRSEQ